jgi:hypothetical protein
MDLYLDYFLFLEFMQCEYTALYYEYYDIMRLMRLISESEANFFCSSARHIYNIYNTCPCAAPI